MAIKYIIPLIILIIVLGTGIFYWQKNKNNENQNSSNKKNTGTVAGIDIEGSGSGFANIDNSPNTNTSTKITDGNTYQIKIGEIRKPVNDAMYDLTDRLKYQKKYNKDDVVSAAKIAREKTEDGKKKIEELNIDPKFNYVHKKHIQSVQYLIEAIDAVDELLKTGETKYSDEFNLKIDYSNREINNLSMPK